MFDIIGMILLLITAPIWLVTFIISYGIRAGLRLCKRLTDEIWAD
jgi:hypothetical protein